MTALAAFQGNGFAVIGADSRATDEGGRTINLSNKKITWDDNKQYLFAITGASRGGNLIQQGWTPPDAPAFVDIDHLDRWVTQSFIPLLRDHFIDSGYDGKWEGEGAWQDSAFIFAVNGIIYPIYQDYSWDRDARGIYYNGSGGDIALGAMTALGIDKCKDDPQKAKQIIKKALELSCEWNAYCTTPIIVEIQYS